VNRRPTDNLKTLWEGSGYLASDLNDFSYRRTDWPLREQARSHRKAKQKQNQKIAAFGSSYSWIA
jgi:hypothetical protein